MNDKTIDLLNKSWLMQWVGNYEKSIKIIEEVENALIDKGQKVSITPKSDISYEIEERYYLTEGTYSTKKEKKEKIKRTRERLIEMQAKKLYDISSKHKKKLSDKKDKVEHSSFVPFVPDYSQSISCLSIKTDLLKYEVRLVVNETFQWGISPEMQLQIDGFHTAIETVNCHEAVILIDSESVSGIAHFSSLGIGEGFFYEQQGFRSPDRSLLSTTLMKELAIKIFILESSN